MELAGLQKSTLIDFPGKLSCVVFLTGCNFKCPYCHNGELARGEWPERIPLASFIEFLVPRRQLLDGVVITGGEPTLSPQLGDLCRAIRQLDLSVKLDTNGTRPEVLEKLFEQRLVDYVAMDLKAPLDRYAPDLTHQDIRAALRHSIHLIIQAAPDYEFRTTCVRPFVDETHIVEMARAIRGARRYVLQSFRPEKLLRADYFTHLDPVIPKSQIERLRDLAAPLVQQCQIRVGHD